MKEQKFSIGITSTFVDNDAVSLVQRVVTDVVYGTIPNSEVVCVVSTRKTGDNPETDKRLAAMRSFLEDTPLIEVSARAAGRVPKKDPTMEEKNLYDQKVIRAIYERCGQLPEIAVMLGDMIVRGSNWCKTIPSLNLHPDLPISLGGTEGIYWNVIGSWALEKRREGGAMMHLITPSLDKGPTVSYIRFPLINITDTLPEDERERDVLVQQQTELKDKPTHQFFIQARRREFSYEEPLVIETLKAIAARRILINEGIKGLDLTNEVVCRR